MKKLISIVLTLTLLLSLSGCGMTLLRNVYEDQTGETLPEGRVVEETTYYLQKTTVTAADGSSSGSEYLYKDAVDKDRHVIKQKIGAVYYENGEETGREDYTLDEQGSILTITPSWEGGESQTFEYTYDENGLIATETAYLNGELNYTAAYTYDENGNILTKEYHTDSVERIEYTYDDQSRVIEANGFLDDHHLNRTVTEYAENGKRHKVTVYDGDGNIAYYEEYTHDGSKETVHEYAGDGTLQRYLINTYSYADIVVKEEAYEPDGTLITTTVWHYVPSSYSYIEYE